MKIGIRVGDLMTRNFIYVSPSTDLKKCAETMAKKRVGSLIVKENEKLLGILTEKDIIWSIVKKSRDLNKVQARDLMKRKVITISPSADISEALDKIKKTRVRRLPVVEHGNVIGMLTLNDILKIEPGLYQLIAENIKIREETEKLKRSGEIKNKHGICESCGQYDLLLNDDNQWICELCFNSK
ncbi:MAG: cyclic nucleotide-binding/CBS domain-containing protein [Nanoarchaeota archaeon]